MQRGAVGRHTVVPGESLPVPAACTLCGPRSHLQSHLGWELRLPVSHRGCAWGFIPACAGLRWGRCLGAGGSGKGCIAIRLPT